VSFRLRTGTDDDTDKLSSSVNPKILLLLVGSVASTSEGASFSYVSLRCVRVFFTSPLASLAHSLKKAKDTINQRKHDPERVVAPEKVKDPENCTCIVHI
jgi:hypothetical protein